MFASFVAVLLLQAGAVLMMTAPLPDEEDAGRSGRTSRVAARRRSALFRFDGTAWCNLVRNTGDPLVGMSRDVVVVAGTWLLVDRGRYNFAWGGASIFIYLRRGFEPDGNAAVPLPPLPPQSSASAAPRQDAAGGGPGVWVVCSPSGVKMRATHALRSESCGRLEPNVRCEVVEVRRARGVVRVHVTAPVDGWCTARLSSGKVLMARVGGGGGCYGRW